MNSPIVLSDRQIQTNYKINAFSTYYVIDEYLQISSRLMGYSSQLGISVRAKIHAN
ncbi:MAG: hypothetical protein ACTJH9_03365 [Pseudoalteromonas sp.]|uniref:hypothetical protein n=1 Tax=unclassified Pseudoalteromonas TaxID=194690 RepID=UPI003F994689